MSDEETEEVPVELLKKLMKEARNLERMVNGEWPGEHREARKLNSEILDYIDE